MSATNRGAARVADDFYETPAWCVREILPFLPWGPVLDPACGSGAILRTVAEAWCLAKCETFGIELDEGRAREAGAVPARVMCGDALDPSVEWEQASIVMNPPYALADAFVARALEFRDGRTVAALLRLNWIAPRKRAALLRANPPDVYVLTRRPSFTGKGTDATEYAWLVWGPGRGGRWWRLEG